MAEGTELSSAYDLVFADTCVGGSTVASHLGRVRSGLRAFYLADYAVNPLGVKSPRDVREALTGWVRATQGRASRLVVACNTASIRLRDAPEVIDLATELGIRVHSMADFLDRFLAHPPEGVAARRVCLMGTEFTVAQPLYGKRLIRAGAAAVQPLPATRTEAAIAHFRHESTEGRADILEEVAGSIRGVDSVLLACTCFPLVGDLLREVNPELALLDPGVGIRDLEGLEGGDGPNRLTIGIIGSTLSPADIRRNFDQIFSGWELEDVVSVPQGSIGP